MLLLACSHALASSFILQAQASCTHSDDPNLPTHTITLHRAPRAARHHHHHHSSLTQDTGTAGCLDDLMLLQLVARGILPDESEAPELPPTTASLDSALLGTSLDLSNASMLSGASLAVLQRLADRLTDGIVRR